MAEKDLPATVTAGNESDEDKEAQSDAVVGDVQEADLKQSQDSTSPAASSDTDIKIDNARDVEQDDVKNPREPVSSEDCRKPVTLEEDKTSGGGEDDWRPQSDAVVGDVQEADLKQSQDSTSPAASSDTDINIDNARDVEQDNVKNPGEPVSDEYREKPKSCEDDGKPAIVKDSEKPESGEDSGKPVSGEEEVKPAPVKESDEDGGKPVSSEDQAEPVTVHYSKTSEGGESGRKPVSSEDCGKPVTLEEDKTSGGGEDEGKPPVTVQGNKRSESDEDGGKPECGEGDGHPVTLKESNTSESNEDGGKPVRGEDGRKLLTDEDNKEVTTEVSLNDEDSRKAAFEAFQDGRKMEEEERTKKDMETFRDVKVETLEAEGTHKKLHPESTERKYSPLSAVGIFPQDIEVRKRQTGTDKRSSGEVKVATIASLSTSADERDEADRSGTGTRTGDDDTQRIEEVEKKAGSGLVKVAAILVVIVAAAAFLVHLYLESQPPAQDNTQQIDLFLSRLKQVKAHFPNQRAELWNRGTIHLQRHLQTVQPTEPVSVILTAGRGAKQTLRCLAQGLASAFSFARNASVLHIDGASKASQESDQVKFDIDSQLQQAFEGDKPVAVIHQFEELPPGSTLIFYRYCDHENAAYKKTFLIFTVLLGEEEEIPPKMSLSSVEEMVDDHLQKKFLSDGHPVAFDTMDLDKYGGLWSRISHLILPVAAERRIEDEGCKWK